MRAPISTYGSRKCATRVSCAPSPAPDPTPTRPQRWLDHPCRRRLHPVPDRGGPSSTGASMRLVGRTSVIGALDEALADCAAGGSRAVLIEGAAGCGRSALADTVAERAAAAGALVLSAVATVAEQQIPWGVLRQLVHRTPGFRLPDGGTGSGTDGGTSSDSGGGSGATGNSDGGPSRVEDLREFCDRVCELGLDRPVLLCVDDVQHADAESLRHLQYLVRHARGSRVLVVLTGSPHPPSQDPLFTTELMRQPHFRRIRLSPLSRTETARFLELDGCDGLTSDEAHRISGGNPLLLRALSAEYADTAGDAHGEGTHGEATFPAPGGPFAQAVVACVHRAGPVTTTVARTVALLGDHASPARTARTAELTGSAANRGLAALRAAGLLDGVRFRHPAVRDAVLEEAGPAARGRLLRQAARVLHEDGVPAPAVAKLLLAASEDVVPAQDPATAGEPWDADVDVEVLREAAEESLARGEARPATRLLELALETGTDDQVRAALRIRLAQITSRFDPAAAERRVDTLLEAVRSGRPAAEHEQPLAGLLLAQGRIFDATELILNTGADQAGASPLDTMVDTVPGAAERLLRSARLTDATLAPLAQAVTSLLCSEQPDLAVRWSRRLLDEADRCRAPGWSAVFGTLHAEALLRLGDLRGAHTRATAALAALPAQGHGTFVCAPTAVVVRACTEMGQYTEASRLTGRQLPRRQLMSLHGLAYLRARGLHHLALHQPHAALAEFLEVGRLMENWGVDRPAFLPWRTDAARALLCLGEDHRAEQLALRQLAMADARRPHVRGLALRMRALAGDAQQRPTVLAQAIDELHRSGDRVETARAMADLGRTLQADGSSSKGCVMIRSAWQLAKDTGAAPLCQEILPDAPLVTAPVTAPARAEGRTGRAGKAGADKDRPGTSAARLSGSEQRVATLAAQGLTNREISARLFLTVSTVEQHLTRVYRKLRITSRGDLPLDLERADSAPVRA
ncbi:AAA family ATPase [Streptomyces sp. NPDC056921]|uniref:AAA family ATPase n=1 Tax=Streptomyces sp. NPDC056921 TaxID=3345966 RepID=UPI0036457EDC